MSGRPWGSRAAHSSVQQYTCYKTIRLSDPRSRLRRFTLFSELKVEISYQKWSVPASSLKGTPSTQNQTVQKREFEVALLRCQFWWFHSPCFPPRKSFSVLCGCIKSLHKLQGKINKAVIWSSLQKCSKEYKVNRVEQKKIYFFRYSGATYNNI